MKRVEIPFHQVGTQAIFTNVLWEVEPEFARNQMNARLTAYVAGEEQHPFVYFEYTSWWQLFKRQCFPMWLANMFPPKSERREVSVKTIYPWLRTSIPPSIQGPRVVVLVQGEPIGCFVNGTEGFTPIEAIRYQENLMSNEIANNFCHCCHKPLWER